MDLLVGASKVKIQFLEEALKQVQVVPVRLHVLVNLLHDALRFYWIKLLPTLEELDDSVSIIRTSEEESLHIFVSSLLNAIFPWLVGRNQVWDTRLCLIKKLGIWHWGLLGTCSNANFWDLGVINHVVVTHENLSLLAELVSHEDASFILLFVFELKDKIESRYLFLNFWIVAPLYFVKVLLLYVTVDDTLSQLCLTRWEVPLTKTYSLSSSRVLIPLDHLLWLLNI